MESRVKGYSNEMYKNKYGNISKVTNKIEAYFKLTSNYGIKSNKS